MNRIFGIVRGLLHTGAAALTLILSQQALAQSANVSVTAVASPALVAAGSNLSYAITVSNEGPDAATSVTVTDLLPSGTTFVSQSLPANWSCTTPVVGGTGTVTCDVATMAVGTVSLVQVVAVDAAASTGSVIGNTFSVTSATADPNANDNLNVAVAVVGVATSVLPAMPIVITPGSIPGGFNSAPYSQSFSASGGIAPYTFSNEVGRLPNGLTLTPGGLLSGTPQAATVPFDIFVTDVDGRESRIIAGTSIFIPPFTLAAGPAPGTVGAPYNGLIVITGGTQPYSCALTSGTLPPGITLMGDCTLSGTPLTPGTYVVTVLVTDGAALSTTFSVPLLVRAAEIPVPAISPWLLTLLSLMLLIAGAVSGSRKQRLRQS